MPDIKDFYRLMQQARARAGLSQRELARRAMTSQPAVAKLEQIGGNPTVETLARCAAAAGFSLRIDLVPLPAVDRVVERYKQDVARSSLRENLRKSIDERLRSLSDWQEAGVELQRATRQARSQR